MNKLELFFKYAFRGVLVFLTIYNQIVFLKLTEYQQAYFRNDNTHLAKYASYPDVINVNIVAVNGRYLEGGIPIGPDFYYRDKYWHLAPSKCMPVETPDK